MDAVISQWPNSGAKMYHCSLECPKDLFLALFSFWCTIYDLEELSKQLNSRLSVKDTGMCNFQVNTKENYIQSVRSWMTVNKLKLNDAKSEVMVVASSHNQCCLRDISIKIGEAIVAPKPNVKKKPWCFPRRYLINGETSRLCRQKHYLTQEACANVINATVISHLDYHNALLLGITDRQMHQLQVVKTALHVV